MASPVVAMMMAQGAAASGVTWNPSDFTNMSLSNGNRTATKTTDDALRSVRATAGKSTGKWYFEVLINQANPPSDFCLVGVSKTTLATTTFPGNSADSYGYYMDTGGKYNSGTETAYGSSYTTGDVIGVALDMDNGKIWFRKNGTWQASGDPAAGTNAAFTGISGTHFPTMALYRAGGGTPDQVTGRFSAASQSGSLPSGFSAWG